MTDKTPPLPTLPEPRNFILAANITLTQDRATAERQWRMVGQQGSFIEVYTAEQMREYGAACRSSGVPADERAVFEAWAKTLEGSKRLSLARHIGPGYVYSDTDSAWLAWQARAALAAPPAAVPDPQPVAPVLWFKRLDGAAAKPDGRCYDIVFCALDGYAPLYAHPAPAQPEQRKAQIERMKHAVDGECEGLAIDEWQAAAILDYVLEGA